MKSPRVLFFASILAGLFAFSLSASGADVSFYGLNKRQTFVQQSASSVVPRSNEPFKMDVFVNADSGKVTGGSLRLPNGTSKALTWDGDELDLDESFSTVEALHLAYPAGQYQLTINAVTDGTKNLSLAIPSPAFPNAPHVTNFDAAQGFDPNADFTLSWNAFAGGTTADLIELEVTDVDSDEEIYFESGGPGSPGSLNGTSTSVRIPARSLAGGRAYGCRLVFYKLVVFDTTSYPGAVGVVAFSSRTLVTVTTASVATPDVESYGLSKRQKFEQRSDASPALRAESPFDFEAWVEGEFGKITSASLRLPNGTNKSFDSFFGDGWDLDADFTTREALSAAFPAGQYVLTATTDNDGTKTLPLTMSADAFPNAPRIANYEAAQGIDPKSDFLLSWDAFAGGTATDFVEVEIYDPATHDGLFESGEPGENDGLNGTARSVRIPAGSLPAGRVLEGEVTFYKLVVTDTTTFPGATGIVAFVSRTAFSVRTTGTANDVSFAVVAKGQWLRQDSTGAPTPFDSSFVFNASVDGTTRDGLLSGSVRLPNGTTQSLFVGDDDLSLRANFQSQQDLDVAYPSGNYTLTARTAFNGDKSVVLNLAGDAYPATPHVANFDQAQSIDPANDFVLRWDPIAGANSSDFLRIRLEDCQDEEGFETPEFAEPGALNGAMTSFTIPRNALRAGQIYRATLLVARSVAFDETVMGAPAISAYYKELHFSVRTLGAPASCGESELAFVFNYPHGALDAGGNPQISFPLGLRYYYALFNINNVGNLPDKAIFTGPAGSGLSNTESSGFYPHPDGNGAGYGTTSIDTPPFPPGGTYKVNVGGEEHVIEMAEPNAANKQVIPVPTVIINAQRNISEVRWAFKDQQGNPAVRPAWVREIEVRIGPGNGPYYQARLSPDVTSHVPTMSIPWDSTRMIQVVLYDEHGYQFASYWPPAQPLSIATSSLPSAQVGLSYSVQLESFGGTFPHTWSLAPGSDAIAPGLGLSSAGGIQGTPTSAGIYSFTVRVTDGTGASIERPLQLIVQGVTSNPITRLSNHSLLNAPGAMATDGTTLFIGNGNSILAMPLDGGEVRTIHANVSPCCVVGLAFAGGNVFWIDPNGDPDATAIFRGSAAGGGVTKIHSGFASGQPIVDGSDLTTDGTFLYSVDYVGGKVHRLNLDGSGIMQLGPVRYSGGFATSHQNTIAQRNGILYVADSGRAGTIAPQVVMIPANGGAFATLREGNPFVKPAGIAVSDDAVYVAEPDNTILKISLLDGATTPLHSGGPFVRINRLFYHDNALYISDLGDGAGGAVYRYNLDSTTPQNVIVVKSDANTLAAGLGAGIPSGETQLRLDAGDLTGLNFQPTLVGSFGTGSPVPPDAPAGTQVINIPPGDGQSGFFKVTFNLPAGFADVGLAGRANMDDAGRVFLNGTPITPSLTSGDGNKITHSGNAAFGTTDRTLFRTGVNELVVADLNSGSGPSGGAFYAFIAFRVGEPQADVRVLPIITVTGGAIDVKIRIQGTSGRSYTLEASENLTGDWTTVSTITLSGDHADVADPQAGNHRSRFYRARANP